MAYWDTHNNSSCGLLRRKPKKFNTKKQKEQNSTLRTVPYEMFWFSNKINYQDTELYKVLRRFPKQDDFEWMVGGGCIRRTLTGEKIHPGDIDVYFTSSDKLEKFLQEFEEKNNIIIKYKKSETMDYFTGGTILVCLKLCIDDDFYDMQLISMKDTENGKELIEKFDFTVVSFAYCSGNMYYYDESLDDIRLKRLVYNKQYRTNYKKSFKFSRLIKYMGYGYMPTFKTLLKIFPHF